MFEETRIGGDVRKETSDIMTRPKKEKTRKRIISVRLSEEDYERLKYVEARPGTTRYEVISTGIEMLYNLTKARE